MDLSTANPGSCSSSSSLVPPWTYHVFLSFSGKDTRNNFTDHLYAALQQNNMTTFRDKEGLERGEPISPTLFKAIEDSLSAIVIFSQNYASSYWCLDELQKILESKKKLGRAIFPIFYGVEPSEVRHQNGRYGKALRKHEQRYGEDRVQKWREALKEVSNLFGWNSDNQLEAKLIKDIIEFVWVELRPKLPSYNDDFVGIDSMIKNIGFLLESDSKDVCFIGIYGMSGIGKTTLARVLYERYRAKFDIDCFFDNVTEAFKNRSGLFDLQQKLLAHPKLLKHQVDDTYERKNELRRILQNKKVILVLDDVSDRSHLENLAGSQDWFGEGSRVIITTQDFYLLKAHGKCETYEIKHLLDTESLQLFCLKAFGSDQPKEGYQELSKEVVQYAGGLPLALSVLGSFLRGRSLSEWEEALDEMKQVPHNDIFKILRMSYDRLDDAKKSIFLDIACFFRGMEKDDVTKILKNCGLNATIAIKVLIEKSLVTSNGWTLEMHDLLQIMGRDIVTQESPNDIGKRSRLWSIKDIDHVLGDKTGTRSNQSIVLEPSSEPYEIYSNPEAFLNMYNLKLLMISDVHLLSGLTHLPNSLKVLAWDGYPLEALPLGKRVELVDLKMHHSKVIQPWNETQCFKTLKSIDLCHSKDLTQTPIVSGALKLEQLILEGCINIIEVHQSIGQHKNLAILNMKNCTNLQTFPNKLEMDLLKDFILSGCSKLEKLPEFGENMKCLVMLDLKGCKNLSRLPTTINLLKSVESLKMNGCSKLYSSPNKVDEDQPLEDGTAANPISGYPIFTAISNLALLKELDLSDCNLRDGSIPYDLSCFSSLRVLDLSGNNFSYLPDTFVANLSKLRFLYLNNCPRLQKLPVAPKDLRQLMAQGCVSMEPPFDKLQLWNFFTLEDHKMESTGRIMSLVTGSEIPPWFEEPYYGHLDRETGHVRLDSFIVMTVQIPEHCLASEWWRIDLCLALEHKTSCPTEMSQALVYWKVPCTESGYPYYEDFEHIDVVTDNFQNNILFFTTLRGLQEQLRGDNDLLEISIGSKAYDPNGKMIIRNHACYVYCKDDVERLHKAKAAVDSNSSTPSVASLPNPITSTSDDAMNPWDTPLQPQFQMSNDHFLVNERNKDISEDAMISWDKPLQPQWQMSNDYDILDNEKEDTSDYSMNSRDASLQPQLQMSEDRILENEKEITRENAMMSNENKNISDDTMNSRPDRPQPQLQMSNENNAPSSSMRETRSFIEKFPSSSENSRSPKSIANSVHPTTNYQNLQKFPMRSNEVIDPSCSMPNSSMSESSNTRPVRLPNKTCICDRRAVLKVSHVGKSYYICEDNKCNYIEDNNFEVSPELRILLLTNFIISLCFFIFLFYILFFGK